MQANRDLGSRLDRSVARRDSPDDVIGIAAQNEFHADASLAPHFVQHYVLQNKRIVYQPQPRNQLLSLFNNNLYKILANNYGGERGIRTLEGLAPLTVFETAPFNHSGTSPH